MGKIGFVVDTTDIYYGLKAIGKKMHYGRLLDRVLQYGEAAGEVVSDAVYAFGHAIPDKSQQFEAYLNKTGYLVQFTDVPPTMKYLPVSAAKIAATIYEEAKRCDLFILCVMHNAFGELLDLMNKESIAFKVMTLATSDISKHPLITKDNLLYLTDDLMFAKEAGNARAKPNAPATAK